MRTLAIALLAALMAAPAAAQEKPVTLKKGAGLDLVEANCGACQQRLSSAQGASMTGLPAAPRIDRRLGAGPVPRERNDEGRTAVVTLTIETTRRL